MPQIKHKEKAGEGHAQKNINNQGNTCLKENKISKYRKMAKAKKKYNILAINPGSTSTKIAWFKDEEKVFEKTISHSAKVLEKFSSIWDQYSFRKEEVVRTLEEAGFNLADLDAVVGRGGLIRPIPSGVYVVDEDMIQDARIGVQGPHASNLGCVIAYSIAWEYDIPAYIVDPPAVDDLEPLARISGQAAIPRTSLFHALNIFATARQFARDHKKKFEDLNLIVAHLGGGITVAALRGGRAINVNNGIEEGPFTPERSGSLPVLKIIDMAFSGKYTRQQLRKMVVGKGGLVSYFGTNSAMEVENMVKAGSERYRLVFEAMAYQVAEEIGARSTNLKGKVDGIIITGGLAHSQMFTGWIKERVEHIAPVYIYPGAREMEALAQGALRVLRGEETAKRYGVRTPKVGIFYWDNLEPYVQAINYIEDYFRAKGYVFRKEESNLEILYGNCEGDDQRGRNELDRLVDAGVDLIIAIGSPASALAAQYLRGRNIPLIFTGLYSKEILAGVDWQKEKNLYATFYGIPVEEQFDNTIMKISPEVKRIGVTYKIGELQSNIEHDRVREYCARKGIECFSFDVQDHDDLSAAMKYFEEEKVDWVYLGSDSIIATATAKQLEEIVKRFPTLCVLEDTVRHGGMIAYHISWKELCEHSADFAVKLLNGIEITSSMTYPERRYITANEDTAKRLGFLDKIKEIKGVKLI